jgi:MFS family permease
MAIEKYLVALTVVGIVDAISYMVVTPSLVFYVLKNGGTKDQYGLIMSSFSFASFCTKPIIGFCSDHFGFRVPFVISLLIALSGGFVYMFASALPSGNVAVAAIFAARLLGGVGGANSALGYAYTARTVPSEKQTSVNSLLSLCRILGMAIGPGVNIFIAKVDIPIGNNWSLNSLNSVGLILVICNIIAIASVLFLLEEPKKDDEGGVEGKEAGDDETPKLDDSVSSSPSMAWNDILLSFFSIDILVPMLSIFSFNASFQLIETGFAPAAFDALGWGPVQSSMALGSISFVIAFNMFSK